MSLFLAAALSTTAGRDLDVERDGVERILGGAGAFGQHDRDRLPDIADLAVGDDRLFERLERRRGFLPQRNPRDRRADVGRGDDGVDAGPRAGGAGLDAADAPVRDRAAQDHGVQKIIAGEVVDELAASAQEAKILDPFDRAADKGVACALSGPCSLSLRTLHVRRVGKIALARVLSTRTAALRARGHCAGDGRQSRARAMPTLHVLPFCLQPRSYHDRRMPVEQRAGDAERRQG